MKTQFDYDFKSFNIRVQISDSAILYTDIKVVPTSF